MSSFGTNRCRFTRFRHGGLFDGQAAGWFDGGTQDDGHAGRDSSQHPAVSVRGCGDARGSVVALTGLKDVVVFASPQRDAPPAD